MTLSFLYQRLRSVSRRLSCVPPASRPVTPTTHRRALYIKTLSATLHDDVTTAATNQSTEHGRRRRLVGGRGRGGVAGGRGRQFCPQWKLLGGYSIDDVRIFTFYLDTHIKHTHIHVHTHMHAHTHTHTYMHTHHTHNTHKHTSHQTPTYTHHTHTYTYSHRRTHTHTHTCTHTTHMHMHTLHTHAHAHTPLTKHAHTHPPHTHAHTYTKHTTHTYTHHTPHTTHHTPLTKHTHTPHAHTCKHIHDTYMCANKVGMFRCFRPAYFSRYFSGYSIAGVSSIRKWGISSGTKVDSL